MNEYEHWFLYYRGDTWTSPEGRLSQYPPLQVEQRAQRLARHGIEMFGENLQRDQANLEFGAVGWFPAMTQTQFRRRMRIGSYNNALRFVFRSDFCGHHLQQLTSPQRVLLELRYIHQLSDRDTAHVLAYPASGRGLWDWQRARAESIEAYEALCAAMVADYPVSEPQEPSRRNTNACEAFFPLFPNITPV